MVTKELLQHSFPDFRIHQVKFKESDFYLMTRNGLSFHVDIAHNKVTTINVFKYSTNKSNDEVQESELIDLLNKHIKEYDTE